MKINYICSCVTISCRNPKCALVILGQNKPAKVSPLSYKKEMILFSQFVFKSKHLNGGSVSAGQRSQNLDCMGANQQTVNFMLFVFGIAYLTMSIYILLIRWVLCPFAWNIYKVCISLCVLKAVLAWCSNTQAYCRIGVTQHVLFVFTLLHHRTILFSHCNVHLWDAFLK